MQLSIMGMPSFRFSQEENVSQSARLTMFFERVLDALVLLHFNGANHLANEARKLCRGALTKVLTKVAFWNPSVDFANALESLPEDADLTVLEERIKPIISCIDGVKRVEGQCRDQPPHSPLPLRVHDKDNCILS